jgi:hypothetical protein
MQLKARPMSDSLDKMLESLGNRSEARDLSGLEDEVWTRLEAGKRGNVFGMHPVPVHVALTCVALLVGFAMSQIAGGNPTVRTEFAVSSDAALQPSVLLMGGA